jgi:hypothetical protein
MSAALATSDDKTWQKTWSCPLPWRQVMIKLGKKLGHVRPGGGHHKGAEGGVIHDGGVAEAQRETAAPIAASSAKRINSNAHS